ncbi:hypothetical protein D8B26_003245 [Coccidioides posadasii str. Silveira]|uniref:Alkaline protease n=1 Tax=Coccidioides posadasii (strain RMSCC 757 / Silveira) TaxID=443226 RepID=E9D0A9_COCPS|nr:alkaline protease [Coccidioides posadasii str. Silveira]QVM08559.1 hypothetical protein D8B26_003245 [Coccidioides posadasii str. Silveira]
MRAIISVALFLSLSLLSAVNAAEILSAGDTDDVIPDSYIVVMRDGLSTDAFNSHTTQISGFRNEDRNVKASLKKTFDLNGLKGYSGTFDEATIRQIANDPAVKYIEHDRIANARGLVEQQDAGWNLARISHKKTGARTYVYDESAGAGISVCLVDTGVDVDNPDLGGRATWGANFVDNDDSDGNGHGTFLASLIAGQKHGVAKKAKIIAVKVLDANGSGSYSNVISGIDWCVKYAKEHGISERMVVNLSLGGGYSQAVNQAAENAVLAGMFVSAAVGGSNRDARNDSPASARGVCAIAASTMDDKAALFSNYGSIVAVYAPGQNIMAAGRMGSVTLSGTSFAAGHASGVGAYLLALEKITGDRVCNRIKELAIPVIRNSPSNTTRLLLYNGSGR